MILNNLLCFLLLKEKPIFFNEFVVEVFEEFVLEFVLEDLIKNTKNLDSFFNLILCCYEIHCCNLLINEDYFSKRFKKVIRNLNLW